MKQLLKELLQDRMQYRIKNPIKWKIEVTIENFYSKIRGIKNSIKYFFQRNIRGYDDPTSWDLGFHIMKKALPILKKYKTESHGHPGMFSEAEWVFILNTIIEGFELYVNGYEYESLDNAIKIQDACDLFGKYLTCFWD